MNKTFLIFALLLSWGAVQAAPLEDEPLPFDTKMPPRVVMQQSGVDEPVAVPRPVTRCKTIVKKVHGRKVTKEICSKTETAKASSKSKKSSVAGKSKKSGHKTVVSKKTSKKHKRR